MNISITLNDDLKFIATFNILNVFQLREAMYYHCPCGASSLTDMQLAGYFPERGAIFFFRS